MIENSEARREIAETIGRSLDELVRERMKGLVEEPDITSRVGQRLEDRFNGKILSGYKVRVITETITSHGKKSLERPLGTDLYIALSVEDKKGNKVTKGILIQAKRHEKSKSQQLRDQCARMSLVTKKGSVVWIYEKNRLAVCRATDVLSGGDQVLSSSEFLEEVFRCEIGDKRRVPRGEFGDRDLLRELLTTLGTKYSVSVNLKKQ